MSWRILKSVSDIIEALVLDVAHVHPADTSGRVPGEPVEAFNVSAPPNILPAFSALKCRHALPGPNESLIKHFCHWLHLGGYGPVSRMVYTISARLVFSLDETDWRKIDLAQNLAPARAHVHEHCSDRSLLHWFDTGIDLLVTYLAIRQPRAQLRRSLCVAQTSLPQPPLPDSSADLDESAVTLLPVTQRPIAKAKQERRKFVTCMQIDMPVAIVPFGDLPERNQSFLIDYLNWLAACGYQPRARNLYGRAARLFFSLVTKDWHDLDPEMACLRVRNWLLENRPSEATRMAYQTGLKRLQSYLIARQAVPRPARKHPTHTTQHNAPEMETQPVVLPPSAPAKPSATRSQNPHIRLLSTLSQTLRDSLEAYYMHYRRNWPLEREHELATNWWNHHTRTLRNLRAAGNKVELPGDLSPALWFGYVDARRAQGIMNITLNSELCALKGWLAWLSLDDAYVINPRMLQLKTLQQAERLPRDVPASELTKVQQAIELDTTSSDPAVRRQAVMDLAWFVLMLHSGLRTGEVRRLELSEIDWERRRITVREVTKGLRARMTPFSTSAAKVLNNWITLRNATSDDLTPLPQNVFLYFGRPLTESYCASRLNTLGERTGVPCTPHQLRHSCATLLLNAGMPIHQVQDVLGHKRLSTTTQYARHYDGTVAADYARAMMSVEVSLAPVNPAVHSTGDRGILHAAAFIAMLDSIKSLGTLNSAQLDVLARLRLGIVASS